MFSTTALIASLAGSPLVACGGENGSKPLPTGGSGAGSMGGSGAGGTTPTGGASGVNSGEGGAGANPGGSSGEGGAPGAGGAPGEGGTGGMRVFDAGDDPALNNVGPGSMCDRLSTLQCAGEAFCCGNPGRDFAACKQVMQDGCDDELMFDALAGDAKTGFDPEHARLAYTEIERRASLCDTGIAAFGESVDGLRGMFKGSVGPGGSCTTLNPTLREEAGKALASCLDPSNNACLPENILRWTCTARAPEGGACFTDVNCNAGLFCDNPNLSIAGSMCKPRKAVGDGCGLPNECVSLFCKQGQCVDATVDAAYCLAQ